MYTIFWSKSSVGWIICHTQLFANSHVILDIFPFSTERIDKWLGFLCEPCFIYYHCSVQLRLWMHYIYITNILFLSTTLLTRVWRTFNGKWKELFQDACLWSVALFIMQKWEWGRIEGWRDETNHFCQTYASSQPSRRTWHNIWYSIILGNKHSHASCIFITFARLDVN